MVLVNDGDRLWLAEGFHRFAARQQAGFDAAQFDIYDGDRAAAMEWSVKSNVQHNSLKWTRQDREWFVGKAVTQFPEWSDKRIADLVGMHHDTVAKIRARQGQETPSHRLDSLGRAQPTRKRKRTRPVKGFRLAPLPKRQTLSISNVSDKLSESDGRGDAAEPATPLQEYRPEVNREGNPIKAPSGQVIPEDLRDVFACNDFMDKASKWREVAAMAKSLINMARKDAGRVNDLNLMNPFLAPVVQTLLGRDTKETGECAITLATNLTDLATSLAEHYEHAIPYGICEECSGEGCDECQDAGFTNRAQHVHAGAK
jgi:hypothetical protein